MSLSSRSYWTSMKLSLIQPRPVDTPITSKKSSRDVGQQLVLRFVSGRPAEKDGHRALACALGAARHGGLERAPGVRGRRKYTPGVFRRERGVDEDRQRPRCVLL